MVESQIIQMRMSLLSVIIAFVKILSFTLFYNSYLLSETALSLTSLCTGTNIKTKAVLALLTTTTRPQHPQVTKGS